MGTHPIFESDFDCLTEKLRIDFVNLSKISARVNPGYSSFMKVMRGNLRQLWPQITFWLFTIMVTHYMTKSDCSLREQLIEESRDVPKSKKIEKNPTDSEFPDFGPIDTAGNEIVWKKQHKNHNGFEYDRNIPILFIGGMPRSGTTLMRSMMDAHPKMRCGEETRLVPRILGMRSNWYRSEKEKKRLDEAGVGEKVINAAVSEFILEIIVKHGKPAERLCNKDPFTLKSTKYLIELFPNARFILMTRDGRATAHSIISRQVTISGFDITSYRDVITKWSRAIQQMYDQCMEVGPKYCIQVKYE